MKINLLILIFLFLITMCFSAVKSVPGGILFTYDAPSAENVYIAGSFNDWNATKDKLHKDENGLWSIIIRLPAGKYQYKFVVDGSWYFDQDNPNTEDDGYGGSNSVITVDENGKLKTQSHADKIISGIKSNFNPKVFFSGRYYTDNRFVKKDNYRYYLQKPVHDFNFAIKVKLNAYLQAFTMLNINNTKEGNEMLKTHLNYKKSFVKLRTNLFNLTAFDNIGLFTSDDPLHIIGKIGRYHYKFGYDRRGFLIESREVNRNRKFIDQPISLQAKLLYSDEAGADENDINFGRIILRYDNNADNNGIQTQFGTSFFSYNTRNSENTRQKHISNELDLKFEKYFYDKTWANFMKIYSNMEFLTFKNSDLYDDFSSNPYIISSEYDWMNGSKGYLDIGINFPKSLSVKTDFTTNTVNFYLQTAQTEPVYQPSPNLIKKSIKRKTIGLLANFNNQNFDLNAKMNYLLTTYPDSLVSWSDYFKYLEFTNGTGRWFQKYSDFSFDKLTLLGFKTALLWKISAKYRYNVFSRFDITTNLKCTFANQNFFKIPKYTEIVFTKSVTYKRNWNFYADFRLPIYNDPILNLKTDFKNNENIFLDSYFQLSYKLKRNVEISLGYGVIPEFLNDVTDEFQYGGREEYLNENSGYEDYLQTAYKGVSQKIISAENAMMKDNTIRLRAKLTF